MLLLNDQSCISTQCKQLILLCLIIGSIFPPRNAKEISTHLFFRTQILPDNFSNTKNIRQVDVHTKPQQKVRKPQRVRYGVAHFFEVQQCYGSDLCDGVGCLDLGNHAVGCHSIHPSPPPTYLQVCDGSDNTNLIATLYSCLSPPYLQ